MRHAPAFALALALAAAPALGDEPKVKIDGERASVMVPTLSGEVEISRNQDTGNVVTGEWAKTSRPCPDFCIQPMNPAPGVTTIGELELLAALEDPGFVVIDSRTPDWYLGGTIPGAVNIPYTEAVDRLGELGCEIDFDGWDCAGAKKVALFCNGLWCGQSPTAIRRMIEAGFPAENISYYRGGMQSWHVLGLTVTKPGGS